MNNKLKNYLIYLCFTILFSGFLIFAPFLVTSCSLLSIASLCELNLIGYIIIILSLVITLIYVGKAILSTNAGIILRFLQIIGIINIVQLSLAAPLNDTLHLWRANPDILEIVLQGIIGIFFIFLPYISVVLVSLLSWRKQYSTTTNQTMVPYILTILVGSFYYSISGFGLNRMEYSLFRFAFDTMSYIILSFILGISMFVIRYLFFKEFFKPIQLVMFAVAGSIWYFYSTAVFNFILSSVEENYGLSSVPMAYLSIIATAIFAFNLLVYQILVEKITLNNLQKNKLLIASFATVVLFYVIQLVVSRLI